MLLRFGVFLSWRPLKQFPGQRYLECSASQLHAMHGAFGATHTQQYGQARGSVSAHRDEAEWLLSALLRRGCGLSKPT